MRRFLPATFTVSGQSAVDTVLLPVWAFLVGLLFCGADGFAADLPPKAGSIATSFRKVSPALDGPVGFRSMVPSEIGLNFTNAMTGDLYLTNAVAHNGAGVAIGDVDGDGWADVYLCNLEGPNR